MADDVTVDNGALTDYDVRADEDGGGKKYQLIKLAYGADGVFTWVESGVGLPVAIQGTPAVTVSGTVTVAEPVTVDGTVTVQDGGGSITVDGSVGITGSVVLGAGTANIGDVDVLSVPAPLNLVGGGTEAAALRVTVANDSTGVLSVDDNGGSLTVDGTVAVSGTVTVDTELPAAAALTDNFANPTVPGVGAFLMGWDGTNWDRVRAPGGLIEVADGGGSLTVDGTVAVSGTVTVSATDLDIRNLDVAQDDVRVGGMAALDAAVADNPVGMGARASTAVPTAVSADGDAVWLWALRTGALAVNLRDAAGAEVAVGGGTQYDEDTASAAAEKITMAGVVRKDAAASMVDTDGDRTELQVDASGALRVTGGGGGTEYTEDVASPGDPVGNAQMLRRRDTPASEATTAGDWVAQNATQYGAGFVQILTSAGAFVDSFGGGTQYAEDTAAAAGEQLTMAGVVRRDTASSLVDADGDRTELIVDSTGRLHVNTGTVTISEPVTVDGTVVVTATDLDIRNLVQATDSVAIGDGTTGVTVLTQGQDDATNLNNQLITGAHGYLFDGTNWDRWRGDSTGGGFVQGPVAADLAAAGNPVYVGGRASAAAPTDVSADGDVVPRWHLRNGAAATVLTAAGALIGGDATNGLDVDVTRVQGTVTVAGTVGVSGTVDTELPAAVALTDNFANPTAPGVGAFLMGWDGTNWDRVRAPGGLLEIADGGGSITVDGTVSVSGTVTVSATDLDVRNLDVAQDDVRVAGMAANDAAVADNPVAVGGRASDAVPTAVSADGDAVWAWLDRRGARKVVMVDDAGDSAMDGTNNALRVNVVAGSGAGVSHVDSAAFTVTTDDVVPIAGYRDDTSPDALAEGEAGATRMTEFRALHVNLRDATGAELSVGGGTQYDEDTASAAAEKITMAGVVRKDTAASLVDTDGDRTELQVDSTGRLHVNTGTVTIAEPVTVDGTVSVSGTVTVDSELPAAAALTDNFAGPTVPAVGAFGMLFDGTNWDRMRGNSAGGVFVQGPDAAGGAAVGNPVLVAGQDGSANVRVPTVSSSSRWQVEPVSGSTQIASANGIFAQGPVAHDAAAAGNPVLQGAQMETMADSAPGTRSSADGDATKLATLDGAQYVITTGPQTFSYHDDDVAAVTTDGTIHAAPGAGLSLYITDIIFSIGAATASSIYIEESTTKILGPYYLEAIAGRGLAIHFVTPKKVTANTAALVTNTGSISFSVDILGFIAPG